MVTFSLRVVTGSADVADAMSDVAAARVRWTGDLPARVGSTGRDTLITIDAAVTGVAERIVAPRGAALGG
jgi:hypothetical protein